MSELIDPYTGSWDEQLVRDTFWPDDVDDGAQDFIAWQYDNKGIHFVKSAYKLYVQLEKIKRDGGAGASTSDSSNLNNISDDSWKRIWKLPCPRNVQMFTWRLKHESLALRTTVARKGIPIADTKCLFCSGADEDGAHVFIKCKAVKEVWRELALEKERIELEKIPPVHAMLDFIWGLDEPFGGCGGPIGTRRGKASSRFRPQKWLRGREAVFSSIYRFSVRRLTGRLQTSGAPRSRRTTKLISMDPLFQGSSMQGAHRGEDGGW